MRPTPPTRRSRRASACAPPSPSLPWRERKVIGLYYYGEVTMKQIGAEIGVNESRVSQLHARAIRRLREALGEMGPEQIAEMRQALVAFARKPVMAKARHEDGGARCRARLQAGREAPGDGSPRRPEGCRRVPRTAVAVAR